MWTKMTISVIQLHPHSCSLLMLPLTNKLNSIKAWYYFNKRKGLRLKFVFLPQNSPYHISQFQAFSNIPPSPAGRLVHFSQCSTHSSNTNHMCSDWAAYSTPDKASETHSHAYLPIQSSQLLLNKRPIQKYHQHAALSGLTQNSRKA